MILQINTRFFDTIEISEKNIITFEQALYGFEDYKEFALISFEESNDSFICMQSLQEKDLAFILLNPYSIDKDYAPTATDEDLRLLKITSENTLLVYVIATVRENGSTTANFKCPIIINSENNLAVQIILDNSDYSMKYPVISDKEQGGK